MSTIVGKPSINQKFFQFRDFMSETRVPSMCGDRVYKLGGDAPLKLILSDLPWEGVPFLIEL